MGRQAYTRGVFTEAENRAAFSSAMILSYQIWQRTFGGDPAIVGRRIKDDDWSPIVVGVMPPAPIDLRISGGGHLRVRSLSCADRNRQKAARFALATRRYGRVRTHLLPLFFEGSQIIREWALIASDRAEFGDQRNSAMPGTPDVG